MDIFTTGQESTKYVLLDLIGAGGMAAVYKGLLSGHRGFEKLIVLKKLHSHLAQDPEIVANFIDEARLAALLQHENIATIYDFGEMDGSYFIAMEYLFGRDLHSIMARLRETGRPMDVDIALLVALKMCEAMEYAHTLKDFQQRPLNIIHRDITPHNVFITYDGKVKIIDFGIAKAEIFDNQTKAGVVKGKVSYMSPEQLVGGDIDLRSDIFSIAILLYEMLTGQRMYSGDTATLIRKCMAVEYEPLEEIRPGLEHGLYAVLHRALVKDRAARYQSCREMRDDIEDCLFSITARPDSQRLTRYIRQLFENEFATEKANLLPPETAWSGPGDATDQNLTTIERTASVSDPRAVDPISFLRRITSRDRPRRITIAVGIVCCAGLLFFLYLQLFQAGKQIVTAQPQAIPEMYHGHEAVAVEDQQEKTEADSPDELSILMGEAKKRMEEQRFTIPEQDSAYGYFRRILAIDPENSQAKEGIRSIGERYADLADNALSANNFSDAITFINRGLSVLPRNGRLLLLKDQVAVQKRQFIAALSSKARRSLEKNNLTTPVGDCAYEYYQEILRLDSGNHAALAGIRGIGDRYALLAENAYRNMEIERSRKLVQKGLAVVPDQGQLLQLQQDLSKSQPEIFLKSLEKKLGTLFKGMQR